MDRQSFDVPYTVNCYPAVPGIAITTDLAMRKGFVHSGSLQISEQGKVLDAEIDFGEMVFSSMDALSHTTSEAYFNGDHYTFVYRRCEPGKAPVINQLYHYHQTNEACRAYSEELVKKIKSVLVDDNKVPVTFWYLDSDGPSSYGSDIIVPNWDEIKGNYPANLATNLKDLIEYKLGTENGSLILLHGMAGTGKTYMIRSLLKAWKEQCQINYIVDVDSLFGTGGAPYLVRMLVPDANERFKLFILEDTGEMVSKDAKQQVGQGLSRMLNVSDGILGQGCKIILLMTTNEPLSSLHDAVSRPGRCFANIEFTTFSPTEAKTWLVENQIEHVPVSKHMTLAELYEIRNQHLIVNKVHKRIGFSS